MEAGQQLAFEHQMAAVSVAPKISMLHQDYSTAKEENMCPLSRQQLIG